MKSIRNLALCLTICLNIIIVAIIILSLSGILSVFERVTLALVHFRHGPLIYGLHGLFLFVCDGIKLYSKYSIELVFGLGMILFTTLICSFCFTASNIASDLGILS